MAGKRAPRLSSAMQSALTKALRSVEKRPEDAATVALARRYARMIDEDAANVWRIGPRLLDVLVELRMTPKARNAVVKGGDAGDGGGFDSEQQQRAVLYALQDDEHQRGAR